MTVWRHDWKLKAKDKPISTSKKIYHTDKGAVEYEPVYRDLPLIDEKTKKILLYIVVGVGIFIITTILMQNFFLFLFILVPVYLIISFLAGREERERKLERTREVRQLKSEVKELKQEQEQPQTPIKKVQEEPIIKVIKERRSFFCQLDNVQHPKTASGYQCITCSRMICADCYNKIIEVEVPDCPFCDGKLTRVQ